MRERQIGNLIDEIQKKSQLDYISDLHASWNWWAVSTAVRRIPEVKYSANDWELAYQYITGSVSEENHGKEELIHELRGGQSKELCFLMREVHVSGMSEEKRLRS